MAGLFITFEGGDGAGKSTQAALLEKWLADAGREVVRTREPGGTPLGVQLREIVLHSRDHLDERAEALIYAADRAHHIQSVVRPAIERGAVVVQDRYLDSSVAYQGAGRGLGEERIRDLSMWATRELRPDLTVLLDLDVVEGKRRLSSDNKPFDRLESEALEFHSRVREAFLAIARAEPERVLVVDATLPPDEIADLIRHRVSALDSSLNQPRP